MANPATTHVIEIESGIGEPAFIPLTLGQELQPISVGKKGMWRVEGARVLDVHAFVYFDGNSLFLQSADEQSPAMVDGYRVGKAWTELHAPCKIEVGGARLRYRSLAGDAPAAGADRLPRVGAEPEEPAPESATIAQPRAPVQAPSPGAPPVNAYAATMRSDPGQRPGAGPSRPGSGPPRPGGNDAPLTFPKPDRPFAPGALAARVDDESTRIAPLESTGARAGISTSVSVMPAPRPAAGRPVEEDLSTRPEAARAMKPATGSVQALQPSGPYPQVAMPQGVQPMGAPLPSGMIQGVMPLGPGATGAIPAMMQPGGMPPGMMPGMSPSGAYPQQGFGQQGYPPGYPPGAMGPMPSGAYPQMQGQSVPGMPPPYGSVGPQGATAGPKQGTQSFQDAMKDPATRKRLLAMGVILLGGAYLLLMDDDEPVPAPQVVLDAGMEASTMASTTPTGTPSGAPSTIPSALSSPCPPGFQPYGAVTPGQAITCVPASAPSGAPSATAASTPASGATDAGAPATVDAGTTKLAAGKKTLERQAVDYVATGDYAKAAAIYENLSRQAPDNKVYSEALRIVRMKLDGGT